MNTVKAHKKTLKNGSTGLEYTCAKCYSFNVRETVLNVDKDYFKGIKYLHSTCTSCESSNYINGLIEDFEVDIKIKDRIEVFFINFWLKYSFEVKLLIILTLFTSTIAIGAFLFYKLSIF
jgi:hypothetical protein